MAFLVLTSPEIRVIISPQKAILSQNHNLVLVDSPHGGIDGGCSSAQGDVEKSINLNILLDLRGISDRPDD